MTDADTPTPPPAGPNKYLPTLGLDLIQNKPNLAPATNAPSRVVRPNPPTPRPPHNDIIFSADASSPARTLEELLTYTESVHASDLHLAPHHVPLVRIHGDLAPVPGKERLAADQTDALSEVLMNNGQRNNLAQTGAADGACSAPSGARFRFNIFLRQGKRAIVLRRLEDTFRTLAELGLPDDLYRLADLREGLVVFSGPTGCGKSTTLSTLLDKINRERRCHIITIEDPVEYIHHPQLAEVNQRELYTDVPDFNSALVAALREDPDVILVGECRDLKTIRMAITAAETGHLVFTTVHAGDCIGTIERLVGVFPADEQDGIRRQLALVLQAIVNQQLLPTHAKSGKRGRVATAEVLINTTAVSNLIVQGKPQMIYSCMETGRNVGMQTMDQDIARLWTTGLIDEQTALATCKNPALVKERAKFLTNNPPAPRKDPLFADDD